MEWIHSVGADSLLSFLGSGSIHFFQCGSRCFRQWWLHWRYFGMGERADSSIVKHGRGLHHCTIGVFGAGAEVASSVFWAWIGCCFFRFLIMGPDSPHLCGFIVCFCMGEEAALCIFWPTTEGKHSQNKIRNASFSAGQSPAQSPFLSCRGIISSPYFLVCRGIWNHVYWLVFVFSARKQDLNGVGLLIFVDSHSS